MLTSYDKEGLGYRAKYEAKFGIFSRIMLLGGQKHHFLQDSVHISKFCAVYQILRKIPRVQNPGGTGCFVNMQRYNTILQC